MSIGDELPKFQAGARMPTFEGMDAAERMRRTMAEVSNLSFLTALKRYFDGGGKA